MNPESCPDRKGDENNMPRPLQVIVRGAALAAAIGMATTASAVELPLRGDLAGATRLHIVAEEDTFHDVARQNELGYVELRAANPGVDPWIPPGGAVLTLPTGFVLPAAPRKGIVVNLAEQRLYYFQSDRSTVTTYPVGIPRDTTLIPVGTTTVVGKRKNPTWFPPPSIRAARPAV